MFVGSTGSAHLGGMSPLKRSRDEGPQSQGDKFTTAETDWKPVKPSVTKPTAETGGTLRRVLGSAMMLTLGVGLTLGAAGCASVGTAYAAGPNQPQIVQVQTQKPKSEQAKGSAKASSQQQQGAAYKIGKGLNETGKGLKEATQPALDKGKEVGLEIGEAGKQVGQEIGQAGKEFGQGVAREAKAFWRGLTGK